MIARFLGLFRAVSLNVKIEDLRHKISQTESLLAKANKRLEKHEQLRIECEKVLEQARAEAAAADARVLAIQKENESIREHFEHALALKDQRIEIYEQVAMPMMAEICEWQRAHTRAQIAVQSRLQMGEAEGGA
jgi:chromosome segregation ATPase